MIDIIKKDFLILCSGVNDFIGIETWNPSLNPMQN